MHPESQTPLESKAQKFASMSPQDQHRRWQAKWNVINEAVTEAFETIKESGEVFDPDELYPLYPLIAANICTCLLGFSPERLVESSVVTEALFERLPGIGSVNRELAGSRQ